ncbi:hypothetical protein NPX13_g7362 [Xylaria arbuscula]|uniref:R3H domain-containing protein n=1 Tax=Xylaria arbuscula TaxID=114810 RepID=A0A9W8NAG7_9PEZI|nr:hypothetical protein NPX13_g7362 [Xylaria arbuscula]
MASEEGSHDPVRSRGQRARGGRVSRSRGGRGGRGNQQRNPQPTESSDGRQGSSAAIPVSVPTVDQSASQTARGRGRREARGSRRGRGLAASGQRTTIAANRAFGGRLTTETEADDQNGEASTSLDAGAAVFVPGQPFVRPSSKAVESVPKPARRLSKSTAPDLPTRIHEDINNGQIKLPAQDEQQPQQQQWRCPGCNSTMNDEPGVYHCWCGKEINLKCVIEALARPASKQYLRKSAVIVGGPSCNRLSRAVQEFRNAASIVRGLDPAVTLRSHSCNKLCHRSGACEDEGIPGSHCHQPCGKTRSCGHLDTEQCHAPYPCKEDKPCQAKTFVTCECQHRKQEIKCLATKDQPSPQRPLLKCDDECLRLQRNARLANALNIDPQSHTDDHVPYSDKTLKFYKENPQWAHVYEREFRVFAGDRGEKRLRFKPMKSHQRAFIHSLAEDFGLDSESGDPEPHRHVCLFKTPRFVSAPVKTLAQCAKIRANQDLTTQQSTLANDATVEPYNALLLTNPQFGLTIEELEAAFKKDYAAHPTVTFHTSFLPSEEIVIKGSGTWTTQTLEAALTALKPNLQQTVRRLKLADNVSLCSVDESLNVLRREEGHLSSGSGGGWSAVVGRSAARPKTVAGPSSLPLRSKFIALKREPKKEVEEPVEEDWEAAAERSENGEDDAPENV